MEPEQQIRMLEKRFKGVILSLPLVMGNEAVNFSLTNFAQQGFNGQTFQRWAPRKQGWRKKPRKGSILIFTGNLRRSIRITRLNADAVWIGSAIKYARIHNEGFRGTITQSVKAHTRKINSIATVQSIASRRTSKRKVQVGSSMVSAHTRTIKQHIPKRQFMGESPYLRSRMLRVATAEFMREIRFIKP